MNSAGKFLVVEVAEVSEGAAQPPSPPGPVVFMVRVFGIFATFKVCTGANRQRISTRIDLSSAVYGVYTKVPFVRFKPRFVADRAFLYTMTCTMQDVNGCFLRFKRLFNVAFVHTVPLVQAYHMPMFAP